MNNWDMRLPGAEMWGPYLEQSPVPPAAFAENPWEALRSFLPESLPSALHTAASGYAAVLTFLVLGAVIALLLGGHADGTLLDLVCAGGCGVLLWEKLVALSETLCTQIESWNRFLLGFLPVYAGVLTLGGESVAGASAGGFLLTLLCALAQGLTVLVPPLLQCYLALSMACCICAETGLGSFCKAVGRALEKMFFVVSYSVYAYYRYTFCIHIFCIFCLSDSKVSEFSAKITISFESANVYVIIFLKKIIL